jgi:uridine phosphorylase
LQDNLALGDVIIAHAAVMDDGTSRTYAPAGYPACADPLLTWELVAQARQMNIPPRAVWCAAMTVSIPIVRRNWMRSGRRAAFWARIWRAPL